TPRGWKAAWPLRAWKLRAVAAAAGTPSPRRSPRLHSYGNHLNSLSCGGRDDHSSADRVHGNVVRLFPGRKAVLLLWLAAGDVEGDDLVGRGERHPEQVALRVVGEPVRRSGHRVPLAHQQRVQGERQQ